MSDMTEAIRALIDEKGFTVDSVKRTIEATITAAYKKAFGKMAENCIVKFVEDDDGEITDALVYSRKTIVDGVYDPVTEIDLEDALKLSSECELGDEIDILVDPKEFGRSAVSVGKQTAHMGVNESYKDRLYDEYKDKIGQIIVGFYQRSYRESIYVEVGNVEGVIPKKYQHPSDLKRLEENDRVKALVVDVKKTNSSIQLILSRIDPNLVRNILELEVPELSDGTVVIRKIVRDAGYRTKIAVYTDHENVDPVGACVGQRGARIQNVIKELDGEKIDVLKWEEDPVKFIKNALSPAEVDRVLIGDVERRQALAIVPDTQYSLAIGKQGNNVRLANKLCDWSIDVKTASQAEEMDLSEYSRRQVEGVFNEVSEDEEEFSLVSSLPEVPKDLSAILSDSDFDDIQAFVDAYYDGALEKSGLLTKEQIETLFAIIHNYVEIVDDDAEEGEVQE